MRRVEFPTRCSPSKKRTRLFDFLFITSRIFLLIYFFSYTPVVAKCSYELGVLKYSKCTLPLWMTYRSAEEFICIFCLVFPPLCLSVAQWSSEDKVLKGLQALHSSCLVVQKICYSTPLVEMQLSPMSDVWRAFWGKARRGGGGGADGCGEQSCYVM